MFASAIYLDYSGSCYVSLPCRPLICSAGWLFISLSPPPLWIFKVVVSGVHLRLFPPISSCLGMVAWGYLLGFFVRRAICPRWGFARRLLSDQDVDPGVLSNYVRCGANESNQDGWIFLGYWGWESLSCLLMYASVVRVCFCLVLSYVLFKGVPCCICRWVASFLSYLFVTIVFIS